MATDFQTWFQGSQVVDPEGKPLRVYHGTRSQKRIWKFRTPAYFSGSPEFSNKFGATATYPVYLSIKRPYRLDGATDGSHFEWDAEDVRRLKEEGYDGVIIDRDQNEDIYTVFDADQVRSAVGVAESAAGVVHALLEGSDSRRAIEAALWEARLRPAIKGPSGRVHIAPRHEPAMHFFAYLAAAEAGEFVDHGIFSASELLKAAETDGQEEDVMDQLRASTLDGFVDQDDDTFYDRHQAAELVQREGELDSTDLLRAPQYESKGPEMATLKKNKVKLTDEERAEVMEREAVWHNGPGGADSPAVWKSVVRGKTWYVTNTHRAYNVAPTLKGAIARFHNFIKSTA